MGSNAQKIRPLMSPENKRALIRKFISNAPKNVSLTDKEIMQEVKAIRKAR
jgi:hypothetical protein